VKIDAERIRAFIEAIPKQPWIAKTTRSRWPLHLFRIDDVRSAARILERGSVCSRGRAQELGLLSQDAASPGVIEQSPDWLKDQVRLYFRPKTPTEYRSEGFRPRDALTMGAHRPMPVVLVFDSVALLVADGTTFTNGNAASRAAGRGDSIEFLQSIPFDKVHHEGPLTEPEKREIVFRRCAEVLVPNELDLRHLKHILCRSQAEYQTLANLLSPPARAKYAQLIGVSARVHYRLWSFLDSVDLASERVTFRFSSSSLAPGPFDAVAEISSTTGTVVGRWRNQAFHANSTLVLNLRAISNNLRTYRVTFTLDGSLAYCGSFKAEAELL